MEFGMPTLVENRTLEDNAALCAGLGLSFIELNMNFPEYQVARLEQTDQLLRLAEGAGIYYTIHLDENLNVADFNPLVAEAYLETVRRTVAVAQRLLPLRDRFGDSAQPLTVNMHLHHGIHITLPDQKVQMYDRDFDTYLASFVRFRARARGGSATAPLGSPSRTRTAFSPTSGGLSNICWKAPSSASPGISATPRPRGRGTCPSSLPMRIG